MRTEEGIARWERHLRPLLTWLPPSLAVRLYSVGRARFLSGMSRRRPLAVEVPEGLERTLWGLRFRSPLTNAAGMFKNGEGFTLSYRQGAGGYLAGTTTADVRHGNVCGRVRWPFVPYPRSGAASNFLGLPNLGHHEVAERLRRLPRQKGFPVGVSVASNAKGSDEEKKLERWVGGMCLYEAASVDFLEINESCPNTEEEPGGFDKLADRLGYVAEKFLRCRRRRLPVIVKFSCDTALADVATLVALLVDLSFDGVNFGNTSVRYQELRTRIAPSEAAVYDYFTASFGGGVSGRPLKEVSLALAAAAVEEVRRLGPGQEFHVLRTGGVEDANDIRRSEEAGVSLSQWYTGYFEAFGRSGHALYRELYGELAAGAGRGS